MGRRKGIFNWGFCWFSVSVWLLVVLEGCGGRGGEGGNPVRDPPILIDEGNALTIFREMKVFQVTFSEEVREVAGKDIGDFVFIKNEVGDIVFEKEEREEVVVGSRSVRIRLKKDVEIKEGGYKVLIVDGVLEDEKGQVLGRVETDFVEVKKEGEASGDEGFEETVDGSTLCKKCPCKVIFSREEKAEACVKVKEGEEDVVFDWEEEEHCCEVGEELVGVVREVDV